MHKTLRRLPSLDFLTGFEAAGRLLSFTRAAEELFVTQSALSRQVQALEEALGVPLFVRGHRALSLTPAGVAFHRDVTAALGALATAAEAARGVVRAPGLTVSTTVSFASLWVIPRLASFRARHPDVEVYVSADDRLIDLGRGEVDVAVRYLADASAPEGAVRLFGERMMPVVSPKLVRRARHAARRLRPISRVTCCCISTIPTAACRGSTGACGSRPNGQPGLKPAGSLRFKLYDQVIQAAVGGQGVALGRIPLIAEHLRDGRLIGAVSRSATTRRAATTRSSRRTPRERADVAGFVSWLRRRGRARARARQGAGVAARRASPRQEAARSPRRAALTCVRHRRPPASHAPLSEPSAWIERFAPLVAAGARVLDLACGHGRHARYFAARGAHVVAVDRDATRWRRSPESRGIETRVARSRVRRVAARGRALRRDRRRQLSASARCSRTCLRALADDGVLLYETFARGNEAYGRPNFGRFGHYNEDGQRLVAEQVLRSIAPKGS